MVRLSTFFSGIEIWEFFICQIKMWYFFSSAIEWAFLGSMRSIIYMNVWGLHVCAFKIKNKNCHKATCQKVIKLTLIESVDAINRRMRLTQCSIKINHKKKVNQWKMLVWTTYFYIFFTAVVILCLLLSTKFIPYMFAYK